MKGQPGELYHGVSVSRKRKSALVSNSAGYQYLRLLDFFYFQKLVEFLRNGSNTFLRMQLKYSLSVDSNSKTNEMCLSVKLTIICFSSQTGVQSLDKMFKKICWKCLLLKSALSCGWEHWFAAVVVVNNSYCRNTSQPPLGGIRPVGGILEN